MKNTTKILFTALCIPFLYIPLVFGWIVIQGEGYNPINPLIDTVLAENFSEEKFNSIQVGMSIKDVTALIGEPFRTQDLKNNINLWYYSHDGKCEWGDFAWIGYCVQFDKNYKVLKAYNYLGYD